MDENYLRKAEQVVLRKCNVRFWQKKSLVRQNNNLIERVMEGFTEEIDLPRLLRETVKEGITISEKRANDYSLTPLITDSGFAQGSVKIWSGMYDNKLFSIWLDSPVGIGLMYKGLPNAIVSFYAPKSNRIMIEQIQGVRPESLDSQRKFSSRGLMPLQWEKLLVKIVEELAVDQKFKEICVVSGDNQEWLGGRGRNSKKHYDDIAVTMNYCQRRDKNWYKEI